MPSVKRCQRSPMQILLPMINANKTYGCFLLNFTDMDLANSRDSFIHFDQAWITEVSYVWGVMAEETVTVRQPTQSLNSPHINSTFKTPLTQSCKLFNPYTFLYLTIFLNISPSPTLSAAELPPYKALLLQYSKGPGPSCVI